MGFFSMAKGDEKFIPRSEAQREVPPPEQLKTSSPDGVFFYGERGLELSRSGSGFTRRSFSVVWPSSGVLQGSDSNLVYF